MKNIYTSLIVLCTTAISPQAQNIGINSTGATPVASAMLDVVSTNRGLLIPRVTLTSTTDVVTIATPAISLLVYNTATAGVVPNIVLPGYYYWDGGKWVSFGGSGGRDWSLLGNAGTTAGTNFMGTTDAIDVVFKANGNESFRIVNASGNVGINTTTPTAKLMAVSNSNTDDGITANHTSGSTTTAYHAVRGNVTNGAYISATGFLAYHNSSNATYGMYAFGGNYAGVLLNKTYIGNLQPVITINTADLEVSNVTAGATNAANLTLRQSTSLTTAGSDMAYLNFADNYIAAPQASIRASRDAASIGVTDLPTRLTFHTTPDGTATLTERMRIIENGNVGIGSTAPAEKLTVENGNIQLGETMGAIGIGRRLYFSDLNNNTDPIYFERQNIATNQSNLNLILGDDNGTPGNTDKFNIRATNNVTPFFTIDGTSMSTGINVVTPTNTLDVNGTVRIRTIAAGATADDILTADATGVITRTAKTIYNNANAWALLGNSGTVATTNFIGTTDNVDLVFKRFNVLSGIISLNNTALGLSTLTNMTATSSNNTAMGVQSLQNVASGNKNTAIGAQSLQGTTGIENSAIGYRAGNVNTLGNYNSFLGSFADVATNNLTKAVAIGYNAKVSASNSLVLGGIGVDALNVGIAVANPAGRLHLYEAVGTVLSPTVGSFILEHGDLGGQSSIFFKSAVNPASDYAYIKYSDDGSGNGGNNENSLLEIGVQNDIPGSIFQDDIALMPSGNVGINTIAPSNTLDVNGTVRIRTTAVGATADDILTVNATGVVTRTTKTIYNNANDWTLVGNSGTIAGTNFIGTTDNVDLIFKRNGLQSGLINQTLSTTSFGYTALNPANTGISNSAFGAGGLFKNTTGYYNTATGTSSLGLNTQGFYNTATGANALSVNTTGNYNTATGANALVLNTTGSNNTGIGSQALYNNTTGASNTAVGFQALFTNSTGASNCATGFQALYSNTTGASNTAAGFQALALNTTGDFNTATGRQSLYTNTTGTKNTANGYGALNFSITASDNTATGYFALNKNTLGTRNTSSGSKALEVNLTGNDNTAIGFQALGANTNAYGNTAIGSNALNLNTTGLNNTAIGDSSLYINSLGTQNTAIGFLSGQTITTGSFNSFLGTRADATLNNLTRAVAIGYNAKVATSNSMVLGGTGVDALNVGIGTTSPLTTLDVTSVAATTATFRSTSADPNGVVSIVTPVINTTSNTSTEMITFSKADGTLIGAVVANLTGNSVAYNTTSDSRLKENIHTTAFGINDLMKIQIADYNRIGNSINLLETGYIAQQLHSIYPQAVTPGGDNAKTNPWGVDYGKITPLIVKAVQDVNTEVEALKLTVKQNTTYQQTQQEQINALVLQNKELAKRLEKLEQK
ncbi:MAG: tail fiber domain-containing protein [Bacteroidia bacterium]|nr:tail fiber domain-containing protein [Bacteroidia bacterium]